MSYKTHGPFIRDLSQLPQKLAQDIKKLEKEIQKLDNQGKTYTRKRKELFKKLEQKKMKANAIQPTWRKEKPELCQK